MKQTRIISGFPGVGKTYLYTNNKNNLIILDSDSSTFDKSQFPYNYIEHIKSNIGKVDIILVSSHKIVRDALVENKIQFTLVYPDRKLKDIYLEKYKNRGSGTMFIDLIKNNWYNWIEELENQENCTRICLGENKTLYDLV